MMESTTYLRVHKQLFKVVITHKAHTRLHRVANNQSGASWIQSSHSVISYSISNDRNKALFLQTKEGLNETKMIIRWRDCLTFPPNCDRVFTNSVGYVTKLIEGLIRMSIFRFKVHRTLRSPQPLHLQTTNELLFHVLALTSWKY